MPFIRVLPSKSVNCPFFYSISVLSSPPGNNSIARNSLVSVSLTSTITVLLHDWIWQYSCDSKIWEYLLPFSDFAIWYVRPYSCRWSSYNCFCLPWRPALPRVLDQIPLLLFQMLRYLARLWKDRSQRSVRRHRLFRIRGLNFSSYFLPSYWY